MKRLYILIITLLFTCLGYAQSITIQEAGGWLETAYAKWQPVSGADSYNVYYSGEGITDQKIDDPLIRSYSSYIRADIPGLKSGNYTIKIAAVMNDVEQTPTSTNTITVESHDRTGFAFNNGRVPGAYKADGTPKNGAVILYITENTKNSISLDVTGANSNPCVGLQTILNGFKKGNDSRPLIIRMVGQITDLSDMLNGDIVIENDNNASSYITLEGIGDDATADGWGIRLKNASNIEIRNIGTMNCNSGEGDNIGLQQNNDYVWVHHVDFFYGDAGGDSDQAKGDGALDTKKSTYVTHSYNHFWDSGKSNLLSNGGETEGYFTYHHNWYDHSDSRHPRVRDHTVHVYNNYFDGISKYGVGATTHSSIFVENNYFRNTKYPMLISEQGTDVYGSNDGTFSGDPGGMIKAYGNYIEGATRFVDQNAFPNDFDAYVVNSASEQIPSSVTTSSGGHSYNNFDTNSSLMYSYSAESPSNARTTVMQLAGRMNGGDFQWTFDNSVDDTSYDVIPALKSALSGYSTSLVSVQGDGAGPVVDPNDPDPEDPTDPDPSDPGDYDHNFTTAGLSSSFYNISGNLSDSKGTVNYGGLTLTQCLKIESSTSITFTTTQESTLTLVFNEGWSGDFKIDGVSRNVSSGILTVTLATGSHTLSKDNTANLYYMSLDYGDDPGTQQYTVTTSSNGNGTVSGGGAFDEGTMISLTATANSGYQFDGWSGDASGTDNPLSVTVDSDKSIAASFSQLSGTTFTISTNVVGQGSISGGGTYAENTSVSLTATPASGYEFSGWSGDASGSSNPISITLDEDKSITATFTEEEVIVGDGFFVATDGNDNNSGISITTPFKTLQKAISVVSPGDYIYVRGGTHIMTESSVVIQQNGTSNANIHVFAYGSEVPVLSFDDIEVSSSRGIVQDGDYWHWKGITIEKAGDNGMLLSGNNNTIEKCIFRRNNDTGLQLSRYNTDADEISEWPSNNLIVDCESFDNADSDSEDADGFAAKLTSGTGNIFRRCVAHHNIDDGWDLYTKSDTGPIGIVIFEDCIAHNNGTLTDGVTSGGGDKNGFKLGSSAHNINHELRRCIAFNNGKHGFTDNGNVGNIKFYNLTSYNNGDYNYHTRDNASHTFRNCITLAGDHTDRIVGDAPLSCNGFDDTDTDWTIVVTASDFETLTPGPNATPTSNGFLNLNSSSSLIDAGCSAPGVTGTGALDLGAIEYGGTPVTQYTVSTSSTGYGSVTGGGTFNDGTVISLTATPYSGYQFDSWSGDASGSNNPLDVSVTSDKSIVANFSAVSAPQYTISTNTNGNGSVSGGGSYDENSTIQLTATPNSGYQFDGWSGDASGQNNPLDVVADANKSITANFSLVSTGQCVNVIYQAEDGFWSNGSVDSNHNGYTGNGFVNTDNNSDEWIEITVYVSDSRSHEVDIYYANGSSDRPANVSVNGSTQLANLALSGTGDWTNWDAAPHTLDLNEGTNTIRYTANGSSGLPNIDKIEVCQGGESAVDTYELTTSVSGLGTISSGGTYDDGTLVSITATPDSGWQFDGWTGDATGTSNPLSVTLDADKNVTANFSQTPVEVTITIQENMAGFCNVEGSVDSNNGGFTGNGFANTANSSGNGIDYTVSSSGGSASLLIHYANGSSDRPADVIINGNSQGIVSFPSTGSWTSWTSVSKTVALSAGENTIRLEGTTGSGLANIDYLEVTAFNASAGSCSDESRIATILNNDEFDVQVKVFPNPVMNQLNISSEQRIDKVEIYSMSGLLISSFNNQLNVIDMSQFKSGHYLIRVFTKEGLHIHRIRKR